ncbi:uncharacterized protein SCHCODRAFT_01166341 [Schizophyllum commune H4-8]|nr:uncharacterized protein SCHCODRAFT_01166341 [Schizophyllum commune H4-8]KAI5894124.1 hypothetical protein SCHCODRAFT_01166341 [Schizophyllum commune H4-8]
MMSLALLTVSSSEFNATSTVFNGAVLASGRTEGHMDEMGQRDLLGLCKMQTARPIEGHACDELEGRPHELTVA